MDAPPVREAPPVRPLSQLGRHYWSWSNCMENDLQELQALIVHYGTKKVLLKWEEGRWVLPGRLYDRLDFRSAFEPVYIIPVVHEIIGSSFTLAFLRQAWRRAKDARVKETNLHCDYEKSVVLMECGDEDIADADDSLKEHGCQWIPIQEAHVFHLVEEAAAIIKQELGLVLKNLQPDNRLAWQRPGWLFAAESWMIDQLRSKCDASLTEKIIQLRSSHLSVILQANTTAGRFFLKCTSPLANDAAYTHALARISPQHVAAPVAVDLSKQMMLIADYGDILNPSIFSEEDCDRLTTNFAHLQMATIGRVEELISAGFPDLRLPKLLEHIDRLASCPVFRSLGNSESSRADVDFFCENTEQIKMELSRLELLKLPATVTHNDLFSSNVYQKDGAENNMFFDFVEGYVSHPFTLWLDSLNQDRYLQEWSSKTEATMHELSDLLYTGGTCYLLALIVLRLQESEVAEFPESEECLESARSSLLKFNLSFRPEDTLSPRAEGPK